MSGLTSYVSRILSIRAIERQSVISLASMLMVTLVGYVATFYFAHTQGPAILGGYFLFLAYYGIFDLVADGGFGSAAVKRISEGAEKNEFFSAFLSLRILLVCGSLLVLLLARPYLVDINQAGLFLPLVLAILTGSFYSVTFNGIYGQGRIGLAKAGELASFLGRIVIQIAAVYLGYGLYGMLGGFIAGLIAGGIIYSRFIHLSLVRFSRRHLKSLLSFSFWIFLTAGGNLIYNISDVILIGYFMSNADVGIYRTAFQLTSVATFTTVALRSVLYPQISGWSSRGEYERVGGSLSRAFTYSLFLAVPVGMGGWLLSESLLYYLYGASFVEGAAAFSILLAMQIINVFMYLQIMTLTAINRPHGAFYATAVSAALNILCNVILIPRYGILGASIATALTMGINASIAYLLLRRTIRVRLEARSVGSILLASLIMGGVVFLFRSFLPIQSAVMLFAIVAIGAGIYLLALFSLDQGIYEEIRNLVRSFGGPWPHWLDYYFT